MDWRRLGFAFLVVISMFVFIGIVFGIANLLWHFVNPIIGTAFGAGIGILFMTTYAYFELKE